MKPIRRGKNKNKGYWVWESEDPKAIYRVPIDKSPGPLNRRRVAQLKRIGR